MVEVEVSSNKIIQITVKPLAKSHKKLYDIYRELIK